MVGKMRRLRDEDLTAFVARLAPAPGTGSVTRVQPLQAPTHLGQCRFLLNNGKQCPQPPLDPAGEAIACAKHAGAAGRVSDAFRLGLRDLRTRQGHSWPTRLALTLTSDLPMDPTQCAGNARTRPARRPLTLRSRAVEV